ncbi:TetR family transcriptional regulator [Acidocella aromatica]|uniref:TetR family transcriptional regulator n=1 Tax=Acidocella aromatica TaxID=1303579 RepID=A0A840VKQ1_9PROT|nr:TetR family transcriptional regulator [Acidocella aromatica]MBB5372070.1 hypothetical protein [Acidocella aromatica]
MNEMDFDTALADATLVTAAFALGAEKGWRHVSPAAAARYAGLDLAKVRAAYPCTGAILKKFGEMADTAALNNALTEGSVRDRLFDILLRRFDFLQMYRPGVVALLRALPFCPPLAFVMAELNIASMGWLLEGAGVDATGLRGALAKRGLLAVWAYGVRAWADDESEDLTATMAAVDKALARAESIVNRFSPKPVAEADTPLPQGASPVE